MTRARPRMARGARPRRDRHPSYACQDSACPHGDRHPAGACWRTIRCPPPTFARSGWTPWSWLPRRDRVGPHGDDMAEHVDQVAGDRDFLHGMLDLAASRPNSRTRRASSRRHVVHPLADQLGDQQAGAQLAQHGLEVVAGPRQARGQRQVVRAAGVAVVAMPACAPLSDEEIVFDHAGADHAARALRPRRRTANGLWRPECGFSDTSIWSAKIGLPAHRPGRWPCDTARRRWRPG